MRKVVVPIYLKLVSFILLLTMISLSTYVYYAIDLFKNDKISYVFESVDDYNENIYQQILEKNQNFLNQLEQVSILGFNTDLILSHLKQDREILSYFELSESKLQRFFSIETKSADTKKLQEMSFDEPAGFLIDEDIVYLYKILKNQKVIGYQIKKEVFLKDFESNLYQTYFVDQNKALGQFEGDLVKEVKERGASAQTFLLDADEKFIVSSRSFNSLFYIISLTNYQKAIAASASLQSHSLYFGLLVAGIVMLLVLVFSRVVSQPINHLTSVVNEFYQTNFNSRSRVDTNDEIGFLSDSFNKMADDINNYMEEVKVKAKMESELRTANLVQAQFFPKEKFENDFCQVAGFYQSATECGGDWWGVYDHGGYTTIILADVTGHGTPAALMTAVLHNSLNSLNQLAKFDQSYYSHSAKIMEFLNQSFSLSTKQLNATAFVLCLNHKNGEVNYSNASHNPPYLLKMSQGEVGKSDIVPLMEARGLRLGQQTDSEYEMHKLQLDNSDKIIFYTDGILEGENQEKKAYGQRKFIQSVLGHQSQNVESLVQKIIADYFQFKQDVSLEDDVTLVAFEFFKKDYYLTNDVTEAEKLNLHVRISNDESCPRWIYKGSLLEHILEIPEDITSLVSLNSFGGQYLLQSTLDKKSKTAHLKFQNETISMVHDQILAELDKLDDTKTFDDLGRYLLIVGTELVRNAIIVNQQQKSAQEIDFEIYEDKENYYIRVMDYHGLLTSQKLTSRLKEVAKNGEYERKTSGAGLGLFMVVCSVNTIVFDVEPGKKTTIITRINKYKRLKHFKEKQTAIFFNKKEKS